MYAYVDHNGQLYRVTGCANPVRLTNHDQNSFVRPWAFSPTNRWLMVSVTQNVSDTSYPECQVLINPTNGAATKTPFCGDGGNDAWTEWPAFIAWLDDNTFLESLTHKDGTVSVVRVNATTFARSPVVTLTYVANFGTTAYPSGIKLAGGALYYGGYASKSEGGGWLHRVSLATGVDTRIVRLGVTGNGGCQVGSNPCNWTGPWDVSPDGSHILYYSPGPTVEPNDYCADGGRDAALLRAQRWLESRAALRRSAAWPRVSRAALLAGWNEGSVGDHDGSDAVPVRHTWRHPGDVGRRCHGAARHLWSRRLAQRWRGGDVGGTGSDGTVYAGDRTPDPDAW